ncbi:MAG: radical SAM protein [Nitrospirae bacterium]|nr:radical SAM protein [Nitrospirota bacterium]
MKSAPDYIQFYPTMRCNLSCDFCFNQTMPFCDDITLSSFKSMADILAGLNIKTLDIMGGEPTLHKDIIPMLEYAGKKSLNLNISSNGTDIAALSEIMERFPKANVGISINSRLSFKKIKGFIKKYRPVVKMVFLDDIDIKLLKRILIAGPDRFYLLYPDVLVTGHVKNTMPFPQFLFSVQRLKLQMTGAVYCSGFIPDTAHYPELSKVRCPAGTTKLGLLPDGSVYPCNLFFGIEEFRLGNLLHDSFESIWNHRRLKFFRAFSRNTCPQASCILHNSCHGGCPAHSFIHHGNLKSPEPRCCADK